MAMVGAKKQAELVEILSRIGHERSRAGGVRLAVIDLLFWVPTLGIIYILMTLWGTLSTADKVGTFWFGGYAPLIGGEMALQASGRWLDTWEDFTHGMMLVLGWMFGPLMWIWGFFSYLDARGFFEEREGA